MATYKNQLFVADDGMSPNEYFIKNRGYFPNYKKKQFVTTYFMVWNDSGRREELRWGYPVLVKYDNGVKGSQCWEGFDTLKEAVERIEVMRVVEKASPVAESFVAYCGFGVVEVDNGTYRVIQGNELVNTKYYQ